MLPHQVFYRLCQLLYIKFIRKWRCVVAHHGIFRATIVHQKLIGFEVLVVASMKVARHFLHTDHINIIWRLGIKGEAQLF